MKKITALSKELIQLTSAGKQAIKGGYTATDDLWEIRKIESEKLERGELEKTKG